MRPLTTLIVTFLLSSCSIIYAQDATSNKNSDHYPYKTEISNDTLNGFTIEYKNYYKVVTNTITQKRYCLLSVEGVIPEDCNVMSTFNIPIKHFSIDPDSYDVIPFIELLGLQGNVTKTLTANITSPCIKGSESSTAADDIVFSSSNSRGISFSANTDTRTPLQKASWLLYLGVFFDMEVKASAIYNQISNDYNCHKHNLGLVSTPKPVAFTSYEESTSTYTVHREAYYHELAADAGLRLVVVNVLQSNKFKAKQEQSRLNIALRGAEAIIDLSLPNLTYDAWFAGDKQAFVNDIQSVPAVANNQIYTLNGLVNANNISDWSQRSVARPDLVLLDLIKHFHKSFEVPSDTAFPTLFPIWIQQFDTLNETRRVMTEDIYGGCADITATAFEQSKCIISASDGALTKSDLSSGDKAGISVGAVLFVIVAVLLGIWLYRRHRRQKRHNFYRMHDLQ